MKEIYRKKLNELLFDENTEIVRLKTENGNIMYIGNDQIIEYDPKYVVVTRENRNFVISTLEELARELNIEVVFRNCGYDFSIYPEGMTGVERTMSKQSVNDAYYADMLENEEIEKILNGATVENIASELRRIKALPKVTHLYPGLHPYQTVTPSKRLYELYRINQPDAYLDNMVEEAKLLAQQEEGKTLRKIKGEKQICNF